MTRLPLLLVLALACSGGDADKTPTTTTPGTSGTTTPPDTGEPHTTVTPTDTAPFTETAAETGFTTDTSGVGTTDTAPPACSPPDANPAPTADGHPTDGWRWAPQGTLFPDRPGVAPTDGDLSPTLVDTGSGLHLIYNRQEGTTQSLWATTSSDGVQWTTPVPVTGLGTDVAYPSLVFHDGVFHLFAGSGSVAYATSTDGIDFTLGDTVLRTPDAGDFATFSLLYPHALIDDTGAVELWYAGFDGARYAIGSVTAASPGATASGATLQLEHDPSGWDNTSVAMPMVVDHLGSRHIWYGGYDTVIANPGPWRIGRYDPATGDRSISLPLGPFGVDAFSTRDPAVVPWGDGWLMVYIGMGDDSIYRLLSATSDVCP